MIFSRARRFAASRIYASDRQFGRRAKLRQTGHSEHGYLRLFLVFRLASQSRTASSTAWDIFRSSWRAAILTSLIISSSMMTSICFLPLGALARPVLAFFLSFAAIAILDSRLTIMLPGQFGCNRALAL